jgi:hypothetical protein
VANEEQPVFAGSVQPDINFFGFAVTPDQAVGSATDPGYYVVIQQHPTEPRFGIDAGVSVGTASHLSIAAGKPAQVPLPPKLTWGFNGAHGRHHAPPPGAAGDPRLELPIVLEFAACKSESGVDPVPATGHRCRHRTRRYALTRQTAKEPRCPSCSFRSPRRSPARKCSARARSPAASPCSLPIRSRTSRAQR